jgi:uncharacterized protein (TIGR03437 family)
MSQVKPFFKYLFFIVLFATLGCEDEATELLPPTITSYTPTSALTGATVVISGTNFGTNANNVSVYFYEDVEAEIVSITNTELTVLVPADAYQGSIRITVGDNEVTGPEFEVLTMCQVFLDGFFLYVPCPRIKPN